MAGDFTIRIGEGLGPSSSNPSDKLSGSGERSALATYAPLLGGIVVGASKEPIFGAGIRASLGILGADPNLIDNLEADLQEGSAISDVGEFIGRWGPTVAMSASVFGLGRAAAVGALRAGAVGRTTGQLGQVAARAASLQEAGGAGTVAAPVLEQATRIAGGNLSVGGLVTVEQLFEGASPAEALKTGAIAAALGGTLEGGLAALPLVPGFRTLQRVRNPQAVRERTRAAAEVPVKNRLRELKGEAREQIETIRTAVGAQRQLRDLAATIGADVGPSNRTRFLEVLRQANVDNPEVLQRVRRAQSNLRALKTEAAATTRVLKDTPLVVEAVIGRKILNPSTEVGEVMQRILTQVAKSPETVLRQSGGVATLAWQAIRQAEVHSQVASGIIRHEVAQIQDMSAKALGLAKTPKNGKFLAPAVDAFERGGLAGVREFDPRLVPTFERIRKVVGSSRGRLTQLGGAEAVPASRLQEQGLAALFPQMFDWRNMPIDKARKILEERLRQQGMSAKQAAEEATRLVKSHGDGIGRYGALELQLSRPGTTLDKLKQNLPLIDDPLVALENYLSGVERRIAYGGRLGINGNLKHTVVEAAQAEGANAGILNTALDVAFGNQFYTGATRRWAENITNTQMASKLTFAALPNLAQSVNTIITFGFRNTMAGIRETVREVGPGATGGRFGILLRSRGIWDSTFASIRESFLDSAQQSTLGRIARTTMRYSGFDWTERMNRSIAASSGLFSFNDDLTRAISGRLRGTSLERARRRVAEQGFDLDDLVSRAKSFNGTTGERVVNLQEALAREGRDLAGEVAWNSLIKTQFPPFRTRRPLFWSTPMGRVMFQFKTFAFNQARLMRDQVLGEASQGNLIPLATVLSLYPVAGELVGTSRTALRNLAGGDVDRANGIQRYLEDFMWVGGFGIVSDTWTAAEMGNAWEIVAGPTLGDLNELAAIVTNADTDRFIKELGRQPLSQFIRIMLGVGVAGGKALANAIDGYLEDNE